jgi:hypothetical protein
MQRNESNLVGRDISQYKLQPQLEEETKKFKKITQVRVTIGYVSLFSRILFMKFTNQFGRLYKNYSQTIIVSRILNNSYTNYVSSNMLQKLCF